MALNHLNLFHYNLYCFLGNHVASSFVHTGTIIFTCTFTRFILLTCLTLYFVKISVHHITTNNNNYDSNRLFLHNNSQLFYCPLGVSKTCKMHWRDEHKGHRLKQWNDKYYNLVNQMTTSSNKNVCREYLMRALVL